jgi:transposase-like protein
MGKQEFSIATLANKIVTEADAYKLLESLRWSNGTPEACPHCGVTDAKFYFLNPQDGTTGRATRTGANTQRRVWKCSACRKQFSVLTNTIFHGTKVSIRTWLFVIFEVCSAKNSVAAREIERKYSLTPKTAWFMLHRIREAMKREPLAGLLEGTLIVDETWIGGKPGNRHASAQIKRGPERWATDKTTVLSVIDKPTGEARSVVVPNVRAKTLRKALEDELSVNLGASTLHTDSARHYLSIAETTKGHESVNHLEGEYVRGAVTTNHIEGFFGQMKRSIDGTHHHVSKEHLPRYLAQFDWLRTFCKDTDSQRMHYLIDMVDGRRLTYRPLTS